MKAYLLPCFTHMQCRHYNTSLMPIQRIGQGEPELPSSLARDSSSRPTGLVWKLFLASFAALFFELFVIRYLSTEIRAFAYLKNLPLIASFFGIGLGMIMGSPPKWLKAIFPAVVLTLLLLIVFAPFFHLTHIPLPRADYYVWGHFPDSSRIAIPLRFLVDMFAILTLVVACFVVLGGIVGEHLAGFAALSGYGVNLAGSLAGVAAFTLLAYLRFPPSVWVFVAILSMIPFFRKSWVALFLFACTLAVTLHTKPNTFWSPYYRIDLRAYPAPAGWDKPPGYELEVNHDFHQHILDLSADFVARNPHAEPNHSALLSYDLPYLVVLHANRVLIVGSGTGNDVAAALRHGVEHVDAVEIDPVILELGKRYHPEHPYDSSRVTIYNDDARAFFKKSHDRYDLIVFGFLDSHTLLSSFSSLRLDNFVYTRESFQEAGRLLRPDAALILSFSSGTSFVNGRMYATLSDAFGVAPHVYDNGYVEGLSFVVTKSPKPQPAKVLQEISEQFTGGKAGALVATDRWPFLYLSSRHVPKSILWILGLFLIGAICLVQKTITLPRLATPKSAHLFLLGAGFLLLETKAVMELSLLLGSTWTVNAVVIAAFLCMALLANSVALYRPLPLPAAYAALFVLLLLSLVLPYSMFSGLSAPLKVFGAAIVVALPVFFSGVIFSQSFRSTPDPAQGLGVNLLGAVVGGALENTVMIGGTLSLGIIAIVLYALSAVFANRSEAVST
jgi:spermidine synthase